MSFHLLCALVAVAIGVGLYVLGVILEWRQRPEVLPDPQDAATRTMRPGAVP